MTTIIVNKVAERVFLSMCWHEMRTLGSAIARIDPDRVPLLIKAIQDASEDVDNA